MRRRARPRASNSDRGMTLVELSVTTALAGIVLVGLLTVVLAITRGVRAVTTTTAAAADLRVALEEVSRLLRVAYRPPGEPSAVVSATGTGMSFYALVDRTGGVAPPPPVLVSYTYDGTCLNETRTAGRKLSAVTAGGSLYAWDATPVTSCLLRTAQAPAFTYYTSGAVTSTSADPTPLPVPAGGLALVGRQSVQSVTVAATSADARRPDVQAVPVRVRVTLQNVVAEAGG